MSTAKIVGAMILIGIGIMVWGYNKQTPAKNSGGEDATIITITPTAWVCVAVRDGKNLDFEIQKINGVKYKYYVATDMDITHPVEMPNSNGNMGFGKTNICFLLKPGQGITSAQVRLIER